VAAAYARTAGSVRGRGRDRVRRELEAMGIDRDLAKAAVEAALPREDEDDRMARALARRHPGPVGDERERRRLYAWLVRQGFEPERVRLSLERKARTQSDEP
jgi:SOS response regulatory protein OraA/RecX